MSMLRNRKGFTLVELMVVVIIVLVLAGIAVPVYIHYIQEGKKSEAFAVIDSVVSGALVHFQKRSTYAGMTIADCRATDDVANARYFTYALTPAPTASTFSVTATVSAVNETWGPVGATIVYNQIGASAALGSAGTGAFVPETW